MISRHLVIAHLVTSIALPLGMSHNAVGQVKHVEHHGQAEAAVEGK